MHSAVNNVYVFMYLKNVVSHLLCLVVITYWIMLSHKHRQSCPHLSHTQVENWIAVCQLLQCNTEAAVSEGVCELLWCTRSVKMMFTGSHFPHQCGSKAGIYKESSIIMSFNLMTNLLNHFASNQISSFFSLLQILKPHVPFKHFLTV